MSQLYPKEHVFSDANEVHEGVGTRQVTPESDSDVSICSRDGSGLERQWLDGETQLVESNVQMDSAPLWEAWLTSCSTDIWRGALHLSALRFETAWQGEHVAGPRGLLRDIPNHGASTAICVLDVTPARLRAREAVSHSGNWFGVEDISSQTESLLASSDHISQRRWLAGWEPWTVE